MHFPILPRINAALEGKEHGPPGSAPTISAGV